MATPIVMPRLGDFMTEGVVTWNKSSGDAVTRGEPLAAIESEKLTYDLEAAEDGILHTVADSGATVPVDQVLGYFLAEGEEPPAAEKPAERRAAARSERSSRSAPSRRAAGSGGAPVRSTPGARKVAASLGIDIAEVPTSGARITEADVRAYAESQTAAKLPPGVPTPSSSVEMTGMRKGIADHMRSSIANTAQLSFFLEVDVTDVQQMRRDASKNSDTTITLAHAIIKACASAISRVPAINSILSEGTVHQFDEVNVGFAAALDEGLIVPVIGGVEQKSISEIAAEMDDLATKAKEGTLLPDAVLGGTFTVSVLGIVDGFTPILNAGQSAILGVGRSVQKPVVRRNEVVVREMLTLSLTVDHQTIDGAVAAAFMRRLQQAIERPTPLFK